MALRRPLVVKEGIVQELPAGDSVDVGGVVAEEALQMEIAWQQAYRAYYNEITYNLDGSIDEVNLYDGPAKAVHLFSKVLGYTGDDLTTIALTRVSDGKVLTKTLGYTGGSLSSVTRTLV
jgi:hypothetical protein